MLSPLSAAVGTEPIAPKTNSPTTKTRPHHPSCRFMRRPNPATRWSGLRHQHIPAEPNAQQYQPTQQNLDRALSSNRRCHEHRRNGRSGVASKTREAMLGALPPDTRLTAEQIREALQLIARLAGPPAEGPIQGVEGAQCREVVPLGQPRTPQTLRGYLG